MTGLDGPRWPLGAATGLGAMPGIDVVEAVRTIAGELPELPFVPQLPDRGLGADPVGHAVAMLVDIWAEAASTSWRVTSGPTRDSRRAKDFLAWDLDAAQDLLAAADTVKVQVLGPWSLAVGLEVPRGSRVLADPGAVRDVAASLAEGLALQLAAVRSRIPGATVIVQLDEPALPAVLAGAVRSAGGFDRLPAVPDTVCADLLTAVLGAVGDATTVVRTDLAMLPVLRRVPLNAAAVDLPAAASTAELDRLGEWFDAGRGLFLGVVDPAVPPHGPLAPDAARITTPLAAIGFGPAAVAWLVVPTPTAGLEHCDPNRVVPVLRRCRDLGRLLAEGAGQ